MKKIYIVGLGPGDSEQITPKAYSALAESDVIIGYDTYFKGGKVKSLTSRICKKMKEKGFSNI